MAASKIAQSIDNINAAENFLQAEDFFQRSLATLNHQDFHYELDLGKHYQTELLQYHYCAPSLREWYNYFEEKQYRDVDQISKRAKKSLIPLFWDVAVELQSASEREKELYNDAMLAGYSKGVAIPVHCGHNVLAIMMLYNTDLPFSEKEKNKQAINNIQMVTMYFTQKILDLALPETRNEHSYTLTPRELLCLKLTALGKTVSEVAKTLAVTEHTANFHIASVNAKLGVKLKHKAVKKAFQMGLLNMTNFQVATV